MSPFSFSFQTSIPAGHMNRTPRIQETLHHMSGYDIYVYMPVHDGEHSFVAAPTPPSTALGELTAAPCYIADKFSRPCITVAMIAFLSNTALPPSCLRWIFVFCFFFASDTLQFIRNLSETLVSAACSHVECAQHASERRERTRGN